MLDFIRIVCAVPPVKVGDVKKNAQDICGFIAKADEAKADIVVFPELALTGYSCGDLFFQNSLWAAVKQGLKEIADCTAQYRQIAAVVGAPVRVGSRLFDCAAVIARGEILGLVPKTVLSPAEKRWFTSGADVDKCWLVPEEIGMIASEDYWSVPLAAKQLITLGEDAQVGIEVGSEMFAPMAPSVNLAVNGAEIIVNPCALPALAGSAGKVRDLIRCRSSQLGCVYALAGAGHTESTSDYVFSGQSVIAENRRILNDNFHFLNTDSMIMMDCDLGRVRADRLRNQQFAAGENDTFVYRNAFTDIRSDGSLYPLRKLPFIPDTKEERYQRCMEIFQIQVTGLKQRLKTINANAVIGISGGLDSTLALLVAVEAMRQLGRPATDVYGVTMPCFGTSDRTYNNAWDLMRKLGINSKEINIRNAVTQHFLDIGHDINVHNGTFENSQARERTQILMDYASVVNGIVVGTGDLSELALGWCTYNGDHMSMYGVNGTVPKTLIRWIIEAVAETETFAPAKAVLQDILDTPISPELLPPDAQGKISQQTEDLVGPYALHDFFLYHMLRYGFGPKKIYALACRAFAEDFDGETIKKWLKNFCRRFFTQQFKRNCMPDGVKVGSVGLGPRGDWVMPSDASGRIWLEEAEVL